MPPENVRTRLKESSVPPLNNDFESNVPQLFILDSRTFVAKSALSRFALFGGHFWPKYGGRGHRNILKDRAFQDPYWSFTDYVKKSLSQNYSMPCIRLLGHKSAHEYFLHFHYH